MARRRHVERLAVVALVVAVVVGGALVLVDAVSERRGAGGADAATVLEQSIRRTAARASVAYEIDLELPAPSGARRVSVTATADTTSSRSVGTVRLQRPSSERVVEFAVQGRRLFLEGEPGAPWVEVDLLAAMRESDDEEIRLVGLAVQRPLDFVSMLRGVSDAERLGQEDLAGITVTHYRAQVSFESAVGRSGRFADAEVLGVVTERIDGSELDVDAWLDANGKLRRLAFGGTIDGGQAYRFVLTVGGFGDGVVEGLPSETSAVLPLDLRDILIP